MSHQIKHLLKKVSGPGKEFTVYYSNDFSAATDMGYRLSHKRYAALDPKGLPILSIVAEDEKTAAVKIREELNKNSSRRAYIPSWEKGGCKIEAKDHYISLSEYTEIGQVTAQDMDEVFRMMQGEIWSPDGEARDFIGASDTQHTSMSIGDIVKNSDNNYYMVAPTGFVEIKIKKQGEQIMTPATKIVKAIIAQNPELDEINKTILYNTGAVDPSPSTELFNRVTLALEEDGTKGISRTTFRRRCQKLVGENFMQIAEVSGSKGINFLLVPVAGPAPKNKPGKAPKKDALSNALVKKLDSHNEKEAKAAAEKAARKAETSKPRYTRQDALVEVLLMGEKGALVEKEHVIGAANDLYKGNGGKDNVKESTWYYNIIIKTAISMGWVEQEGTAIKVVA